MDAVIGNPSARQTRLWSPKAGRWITADFPVEITRVDGSDPCAEGEGEVTRTR